MALLWIYIWTVVVLTITYIIFYKHWRKITQSLTKQIDSLLFNIDLSIYKKHTQIYDYDTTKSLLYHNQTTFFQKWKFYTDITLPLIQDVEYLTWLLQQDIVTQAEVKIIKATYITWQKINTLKEYTHIILIILTLGIAKLLFP